MGDSARPLRVFVTANGCPENRLDAAQHRELLCAAGWEPVSTPAQADLVVFSACGLTTGCEADSLAILRVLKQSMPGTARLVVCGCLTKIDPTGLSREFDGPTLPPDSPQSLAALLGERDAAIPHPTAPLPTCRLAASLNGVSRAPLASTLRRITFDGLAERALKRIEHLRAHDSPALSDCPAGAYFIKIGTGCQGECAYCAVRIARGTITSRPPADIMAQFRDGLARGYTDFVLLGTDQGSYGRDIGTDLAHLLRTMTAEPGEFTLRIRNLEPMGLIAMFDRLRPAFDSGHISLIATPVQTGSDRVLQLMKRHYSIADFAACIRTLNAAYPQIRLRTQVMVGFPQETEEDFRASARLLDELRFDYVEVYCYSPRPNTEAASMPGQVPEHVKAARYRRLLCKVLSQHFRRRLLPGTRAAQAHSGAASARLASPD